MGKRSYRSHIVIAEPIDRNNVGTGLNQRYSTKRARASSIASVPPLEQSLPKMAYFSCFVLLGSPTNSETIEIGCSKTVFCTMLFLTLKTAEKYQFLLY